MAKRNNEDGLNHHGPVIHKVTNEAFRAHTHSPIKRGIPQSLQRLPKTLGSWKYRVRAEVAIDGPTASDAQR